MIINAHIVAFRINLDYFSLIKRSDEFLMNKMGERAKLAEQASFHRKLFSNFRQTR